MRGRADLQATGLAHGGLNDSRGAIVGGGVSLVLQHQFRIMFNL
jgi:hypothetical protein